MTTYTFAGVSTLNGRCKVRWANDILRIKVLAANGHTAIDIVPLRHPMTKLEAVEYLLSIDFDNGRADIRRVLEEAAQERRTGKTAGKTADPVQEPEELALPA